MERFKNYGTVKLIIMVLSFVGALSMMIMIFRFSSQTGKESGNKSGAITDEIIDIVVKEPEKLDKNTYDSIKQKIEFFVRKAAHFTEFAGLGLFVAAFTACITEKKKFIFLISLAFSVLYASSDEIHQLFVAGRGASVRDVLIDTSGAFVGIILVLTALIIISSIKKRKSEKAFAEAEKTDVN